MLRTTLSACAIVVFGCGPAFAEDPGPNATTYRLPPQAMVDLVDAPPTPGVSRSPSREWMVIMDRPSLPPISELAEPELRLAGARINPRTNGPSRGGYFTRLTFRRLADGRDVPVTGLPDHPRVGAVSWSPNAKSIAFIVTREDGIELWAIDVDSGKARRLTDARINAAGGQAFDWVSDSRTLICRLVPEGRGAAPEAPRVPSGPIVEQSTGRKAPSRTYQDLLQNPHDEHLFEHYFSAQLARVTLEGELTPLGEPGIVSGYQPSPDGKYILVHTLHRPYSYLVPMGRFPQRIDVWDMDGKPIHTIADLPLAEDIPVAFASARTGPRSVAWRADAPATLCWAEALDGGDPAVEAAQRDRLFTLAAPFKDKPSPLVSLELRYGGITWGNDRLALVSEWWWKTRKTRTWIVDPCGGGNATLLFDRSSEDRYNDPGTPLTRATPQGTSVLLTAEGGQSILLAGAGASPEGDRPFLDQCSLASKETKRWWRSEAPYYESVVDLLDVTGQKLLTRRESTREPPNYYIRDLSGGTLKAVTEFPHPQPQLADVSKEQIRYERKDGVKLTGTLYLPAGYSPSDGPLPMLMWAYPQEFKSADAAGQVTDSPYRFVRASPLSPLLLLTQGYAVLDDPSMPIVGEGDVEPNDSYVDQLVAGAQAAVDEVVRRGVADPERVAIGGHSYGAFTTANLLAHCELFRTGVARSGAYNRTLTPFSFQSEERTFWEAASTYMTMSPFTHADRVNEPILLIHGEADNNPGTFPMQSERFYNALKGHGATTRLVMLPHESHGYQARESVLHTLWETAEWLDKYLKNASPRPTTPALAEPAAQ